MSRLPKVATKKRYRVSKVQISEVFPPLSSAGDVDRTKSSTMNGKLNGYADAMWNECTPLLHR
jgi:hypothetical protein